jgi:hypothetical protein
MVDANGNDANRLPTKVGTYYYDLEDPTRRTALRDQHYEYMQYDVVFKLNFDPNDPTKAGANPVNPDSPLPQLEYLLLPSRF